MAGILGSVVGGFADSSRSSADLLDQKTITNSDENPKDTIVTMMKDMLDIPKYDNDLETINVIQMKGGKDSWQSFGQHQGLIMRLVDPYKNPQNKMLKVDLMTIKEEDALKQIKLLEAEYEVFVSDFAEYFRAHSIARPRRPFSFTKRKPRATSKEITKRKSININRLEQIEQSEQPLESILECLKEAILCIRTDLEILQEHSTITSFWDIDVDGEQLIHLKEKIEMYRKFSKIDSINKNLSDMVSLYSTNESIRILMKEVVFMLRKDSIFLMEIGRQQNITISKMVDILTQKGPLSPISMQEIYGYCRIIPSESQLIRLNASDRLFKMDDDVIQELLKSKNKLTTQMEILSQKGTLYNQIGWTVDKENVVLKLTIVDQNNDEGPTDGMILKQVTIKNTIEGMASVLAGHYSEFGNYQLLINDCRHYVSRVLEDLELKTISTCQNLLEKASPLIISFSEGTAQASHLQAISEELGMLAEYEYMKHNLEEFTNFGEQAEKLLKKWFLSKSRKVATIENLLSILKQETVGLRAIAEEIELSCGYIQNENVFSTVGIKAEVCTTFLKLLGSPEEDTELLQKLTRLKENEKIRLLPVSTMIRSTCLLHYSGPNGGPWHGTGFLSTLANFRGLMLLSAGHNFEDKGVLLQDFTNFSLIFNNISGIQRMPSSTTISKEVRDKDYIILNLGNLMKDFNCTLVITYGGKQLIQRYNDVPQQLTLKDDKTTLDYFAVIFHADDVQANLEEQGLKFLHCASQSELVPKRGHPVLTFGHPGIDKCKCPAGNCSCTHPLRLSYGKETGSSKHRMEYDLDTLGGNSGSPITGKLYTVKGIHVLGSKTNKAQTMKSVLKDLRQRSLLPTVIS